MAETTPTLLSNFKLDTFYKLFIYIGSVVLILSFFFDVKGYSISLLRYQAMVVIIAGLVCWAWDRFKMVYATLAETDRYRSEEDIKTAYLNILVAYWVLVAITLIVAAIALFH
jgi:hypothetical protein